MTVGQQVYVHREVIPVKEDFTLTSNNVYWMASLAASNHKHVIRPRYEVDVKQYASDTGDETVIGKVFDADRDTNYTVTLIN